MAPSRSVHVSVQSPSMICSRRLLSDKNCQAAHVKGLLQPPRGMRLCLPLCCLLDGSVLQLGGWWKLAWGCEMRWHVLQSSRTWHLLSSVVWGEMLWCCNWVYIWSSNWWEPRMILLLKQTLELWHWWRLLFWHCSVGYAVLRQCDQRWSVVPWKNIWVFNGQTTCFQGFK